jgi:hypothetical protein
MLENLVLDALDVASVTLWVCRLPYALLSVAVLLCHPPQRATMRCAVLSRLWSRYNVRHEDVHMWHHRQWAYHANETN